jgi:formylglycine-generating enzyme required for sulfatase activity
MNNFKSLMFPFGLLLICLFFSRSETFAADRVALVIGNSDYGSGFVSLPNARNDAQDMAAVLQQYGFTVIHKNNLNAKEMKVSMGEFSSHLSQNTVGLFYYAGHGIQIDGINYLIPIGAKIYREEDVEFESVKAQRVITQMEKSGSRVNIVVFDACRNNPFTGSRSSKAGLAVMYARPPKIPIYRDLTLQRGLVIVDVPRGTIISFATAPNQRASENEGKRNGLYTQHLLKAIQTPGLTLEEVFKQTATEVAKASNSVQIPWRNSSLLGEDFCFSDCRQQNDNDEKLRQQIAELKQKLAELQEVVPEPPPLPDRVWKETGKVFQDRLRDGSLGPEMVMIPAGRFRMGDIQSVGSRDEKPVHRVSVNDFAIGRYEVTNSEFRQFVESTGYQTDAEKGKGCYTRKGGWRTVKDANWHNSYFSQAENHPVICVSWNDAIAYTQWLSEQTKMPYTLPSEAQWEYVARAGTESQYWWGNNMKPNQANCWQTSRWRDGTSPVGTFSPNSFQVSDTLGNVWEWVADIWHDNYKGAPLNGEIWKEGGDSANRVLRGGSWASRAKVCRVATRLKYSPRVSSFKVGFRCGLKTVH